MSTTKKVKVPKLDKFDINYIEQDWLVRWREVGPGKDGELVSCWFSTILHFIHKNGARVIFGPVANKEQQIEKDYLLCKEYVAALRNVVAGDLLDEYAIMVRMITASEAERRKALLNVGLVESTCQHQRQGA